MFKPSAAPRWKITTSRLLRMPACAAPNAARVRNDGNGGGADDRHRAVLA